MSVKSFILFSIFFCFISCNENKNTDKENPKMNEYQFEDTNCEYQLNEESIQVNWVAYKLEKKTGVNGAFMSKKLDAKKNAKNPESLLDGLKASVEVKSVSTNDKVRDGKIINSFFLTMKDSLYIKASFSNMMVKTKKENNISGSIDMLVKMNNTNIVLPAKFMISNNKIKVNTVLDIPSFGAQSSLNEINKVCSEKHKGNGSKSVTWPDVAINLSASYSEKCD